MLNPQWVQTFSVLAELRSFTRAAERLGVTQAAVSQHVRQLEDRLGPLLIRRPRQIDVTPAGKALLDYHLEITRADSRLHARLADADADSGEVSLITPGSVGLLLYPVLLDLQMAHPGLVIRHRFAPDQEVLEAVLNNQFELGLLTLRPDDPRLSVSAFAQEQLELVAPAGVEVRDWSDLQRIGFINHPDGQAMATRLLSLAFPGSPGIRGLPVRGFSNQIGLILEPVARGLGFTVIPRYARKAFAHGGAIQVVRKGRPVVDTLWLIRRAEWALPARTLRVIEHLSQHIKEADHASNQL